MTTTSASAVRFAAPPATPEAQMYDTLGELPVDAQHGPVHAVNAGRSPAAQVALDAAPGDGAAAGSGSGQSST